MNEIRCKKCNRLLMKVDNGFCVIECKCPKCGYYNKTDLSVLLEFGTKKGQKEFKNIVAQTI
jgi:phage FluMu protein Com